MEDSDRISETVIFAKNQAQAKYIKERFDANYSRSASIDCRVIHNDLKYVQSLIDDYYIVGKAPYIAVSVNMLDTGINVLEIVNLVFSKCSDPGLGFGRRLATVLDFARACSAPIRTRNSSTFSIIAKTVSSSAGGPRDSTHQFRRQ